LKANANSFFMINLLFKIFITRRKVGVAHFSMRSVLALQQRFTF
jgi:hypothetical protein